MKIIEIEFNKGHEIGLGIIYTKSIKVLTICLLIVNIDVHFS